MTDRPIVVGVDFSPESEIALRLAIASARRLGADIELVHATYMEPSVATGDAETWGNPLWADLVRDHIRSIRQQLADLRERYSNQGVLLSQTLIDRHPAVALATLSEEREARMVVVGTHGRTGFRRLFLGSVAERVARTASTDVLVARPGRASGRLERILVPTDFSAAADSALARAVELAADGAEIDLVHCWKIPALQISYSTGPSLDQYARLIEETAEEQAAPLLARYAGAPVDITFSARCAATVPGILGNAPGYDLIAMGSHGRRGFRRFLLGSVAEATVRHAPCSVLIARAS